MGSKQQLIGLRQQLTGSRQRLTGLRQRFYSTKGTVGFIGLGHMGAPMARNLTRAGFDVIVHDSDATKMSSFPKSEANILALGQRCDRIVTMLPNNAIVECVYERLISNARNQANFIDCSTVSPQIARQVFEKCKSRGIAFLDAPVSGGVKGATQGTLAFLIGGDQTVLEQNEELFMAMGKNVFHCGTSGNGQAAKICNNLILGVSMVALSESLNLGTKLGLDPKILSKVINASSGRSWASEGYNPIPGVMENVPAANGYAGGFAAKLMIKDMMLAQEEATKIGVALPSGDVAAKLYKMLLDGEQDKDFSAVYQCIQRLSQH